jgi:hypothetical protein
MFNSFACFIQSTLRYEPSERPTAKEIMEMLDGHRHLGSKQINPPSKMEILPGLKLQELQKWLNEEMAELNANSGRLKRIKNVFIWDAQMKKLNELLELVNV